MCYEDGGRTNDDGRLTNHHLFWNVKENSPKLSGEAWKHKTLTEMIFVEDRVADQDVVAFCQAWFEIGLFDSKGGQIVKKILDLDFSLF